LPLHRRRALYLRQFVREALESGGTAEELMRQQLQYQLQRLDEIDKRPGKRTEDDRVMRRMFKRNSRWLEEELGIRPRTASRYMVNGRLQGAPEPRLDEDDFVLTKVGQAAARALRGSLAT